MTRDEAFNRLSRVRNEFDAARLAVSYTLDTWDAKGGAFERSEGTSRTELERLRSNLEITFVLRLFASFEGILKDYRVNGLKRRAARMDMHPLMESIAAKQKMDPDTLRTAHDVREYRNDIIHHDVRSPRLDLGQCSRAIGRYLAWLPQQW